MIPSVGKSGGSRRATKACARCRKRKIRCDFEYPTCGACARARAECHGFDSQHGTERPRSTISHLENHVAQLEIELARLRSEQKTDTIEVQGAIIERLTARLADAHAQPGFYKSTAKEDISLLSLDSPSFLSQSPLPPISIESQVPAPKPGGPITSTTIASIPRHVIDIMLKNYCDIYRPQYPCLEEFELYASRDRIFGDAEPSHFDFFSVAMTLAISANTLICHDEKRAIRAAEEFWATAVEHLQFVGHSDPWQRLQALQLLAHYGLLNPKVVNCCNCAAAATRLCIQLGLHQELPLNEQSNRSASEINIRRRLFWTSYNIDAALHTILCLPFAWPRSAITTNYPEFGTHRSPTAHVWAIRRIEAEVTTYLYYPSVDNDCDVSDESFHDWYRGVHENLETWYKEFKSHQKTDLASKIEFYEIMYQAQIFRMNKASPRFPHPTLEMRKKSIRAAIALVKEYASMQRLEKFFYIWHGVHYLVEFGASLLELVLSGLEEIGKSQTHLDGLDVAILKRAISTLPQLLWRASNRWPDIHQHALAIEDIALPVMVKLDNWFKGRLVNVSDLDPITQDIRQKIKGLVLFSASSSATKFISPDNDIETNGLNMLVTASREFMMQDATQPTTVGNSSYIIPAPTRSPTFTTTGGVNSSVDVDWSSHQQLPHMFDQSYLYNDPGTMDSGGSEEILWDMAGMNSDDIFAALLEGQTVIPL